MEIKVTCYEKKFKALLEFLKKNNINFKVVEYRKLYKKAKKYILINNPDVFFYKKLKNFNPKIEICSSIRIISKLNDKMMFSLIDYLNENNFKNWWEKNYIYVYNPDVKLLNYLGRKKILFEWVEIIL